MVGLVGVEARVQVRARAGRERRNTRKVTSAVQEMFKRAKRAICDWRVVFNSPLGPAHGRLVESDCPYGVEPRPCPGLLGWNLSSVISLHFWER